MQAVIVHRDGNGSEDDWPAPESPASSRRRKRREAAAAVKTPFDAACAGLDLEGALCWTRMTQTESDGLRYKRRLLRRAAREFAGDADAAEGTEDEDKEDDDVDKMFNEAHIKFRELMTRGDAFTMVGAIFSFLLLRLKITDLFRTCSTATSAACPRARSSAASSRTSPLRSPRSSPWS